ncbi:hypothetical protein [Nitrospirillum sp. BR 11828]|uniref:hypothetical protein n=1 Tax=Nitrospirillum sp. BR 11828 TaxID=3104325 RepID=UPI002AC9F3C2|nr:hypothetical protein [Nitrospirillum sp. BR 11828]MDZ5648664.1 hypothetical protein [Nitrospirillum sp. BR 11828]
MPRLIARAALLAAAAGCAPLTPPPFPVGPGPTAADAGAPATPWSRPQPRPGAPLSAQPPADASPMPDMPGMDHSHHQGRDTP